MTPPDPPVPSPDPPVPSPDPPVPQPDPPVPQPDPPVPQPDPPVPQPDPSPAVLSLDVGRKNLGVCLLRAGADVTGAADRIAAWTVTTCEPTPHGIAACLRGLPWALECDDVVIERQPAKNATMSRLQHYLEMYFAMAGKPVTVLDAKHKLSFGASTPWWPSEEVNDWNYRVRKKLSVRTVRAFLEATGSEWVAAFDAASKKDDMADSALQAMAYAHHVRPLEVSKRAVVPKRPAPRKPTEAQAKSGRYTKSNVAYFLKGCGTPADVEARVRTAKNRHLTNAVRRLFGTTDACFAELLE